MHIARLSLFGLSLAILASCGGPATVSYRLTFDSTDPQTVEALTQATIRVMQRRLDRMGSALTEQTVTQDAEGANLTFTVEHAGAGEDLTAEMTTPFDLQIMESTTDVDTADLTVEGFGAFNKTDVSGKDIRNIEASTDPKTKGGIVQINFTPEGLAKMKTLFEDNVGNDLGLFVRGKLVSALTVQSADLPNPLVIDGIPDAELASIFADDVNVGTHVTVTPL